ncbi:PTS sugar transporter subunit IIA [Oceanibium sediminis]|uniref:PTS sugar transporter subunit IIA n=1 Tax=Oceanibium sediminis TaxID=2026339 RepID=UPI000DD40303|nr:PTS fructose transporter subunit IIA [Oceanibium sediminis]
MIGIVIVAHGGLATEYLAALEHVVGKRPGIRAISIGAEDARAEKQAEIDAAVAEVDIGDGVAVVTDMFGGTPSNLAIAACDTPGRKVLYGVNLPMLIKLAKARNKPLDVAVQCALDAARKYINCADGLGIRTGVLSA